MESSYFFFLVLPLALLVFFLVALVIYNARKNEEDECEREIKKLRKMFFSGKLDKKTFVNMRNRLKHEKVFHTESKKLFTLLSDNKIDEETYVRLRKVLETSFRERLDRLNDETSEPCMKEPFDASKF